LSLDAEQNQVSGSDAGIHELSVTNDSSWVSTSLATDSITAERRCKTPRDKAVSPRQKKWM
jgi:hypothetical protein